MNSSINHSLSVPLYWSLPGPRKFQADLVLTLERSSAVVVRLNDPHITGLSMAIRQALTEAAPSPERVEFLEIDDGSHLESEIGQHFGRATLTALELANLGTPPRATIAVTPKSTRARQRCREYLETFASERSNGAPGSARLVVIWNQSHDALIPVAHDTVAFAGELSVDEMHAYIALRMVGRHAPGTTSLTRHLVTEFAGSDPLLAEILMAMDVQDLLALPASFMQILPLWNDACTSPGGSPSEPRGALLDWQNSRASGSKSVEATKRLDRLYWRACVRALLPWLEERRFLVVDALRPTLEDFLYPTQGLWHKSNPRSGKASRIEIDELEFNDIVAMTFVGPIVLTPLSARDADLISACHLAKKVRDALAHMRPPSSVDIQGAVRLFDQLFPALVHCAV